MLAALRELGAHPSRTRVVLAGGADVLDADENYRIGQRNIAAARSIVTRLGLPIIAEETGAPLNRTLHFCIGDARLMIKVPHHTIALDMH